MLIPSRNRDELQAWKTIRTIEAFRGSFAARAHFARG